jgi:hypothetical protein
MMTCEQCQELISVFLDNELEEKSSSAIRAHLAVCDVCSKVCEDLAMIIDVCQLEQDAELVPPNPKALWCRINNIIESEAQAEIVKETTAPPPKSGWLPRNWNLSLPQVASAVLGIALLSSLLTIIGIKNFSSPGEDLAVSATAQPTLFEKFLGKFGLVETPQQVRARRMKERQTAIEYWNKRVEARRLQWNAHLREAFDRNLNEIDQVVNEYTLILEENPHDELSGEMLDSALNEKMELLREFSEL